MRVARELLWHSHHQAGGQPGDCTGTEQRATGAAPALPLGSLTPHMAAGAMACKRWDRHRRGDLGQRHTERHRAGRAGQ
ncbi:hypothetical protein GCM10023321_73460 [Pseudonocardia eucalypti]|uniref:Uncharacterized protein n=1 Tax=Pseudonocardia eucalypti TaxID=648755 RepID=A0ABP9R805_9PSEU